MTDPTLAQLYRDRLTTADAAAGMIHDGAKLTMGPAAASPPALLAALAARARAGAVRGLRVYYMLSTGVAGNSIFAPDLADRITPISLFHGGIERALDKGRAASTAPWVDFIPAHFSQIPRALIDHIGVDTLLAQVAPMDSHGYFSLGTNADYTARVAKQPGMRIILEVNPQMPRVAGDCQIHLSQATALIEATTPIPELPPAPRTATDDAIGAIIAGLVEDGACLQMGIGALPDAVCAGLSHHRRLGIHTEMMTNGLAALVKSGVVDNSAKQLHPGLSIFTFAFGDRALYDFLHENSAVAAYPVDYVNAPAVIAQNDRVISVNATTQVDLHGACNSEYVAGRQFSATGGQVDFVRGAYLSRGGRSIIACHSTAAGGAISRIVPQLDGPVTTPRADTHIVVTEYGWADLKGKSLGERAAALIALAHPNFREALERAAFDSRLLARL